MSIIINDYPMNDPLPTRRVVLRGRFRGKPKKDAPVVNVAPAITIRKLVPVIMDDQERGEGDSTNAKMHRLLRGKQ